MKYAFALSILGLALGLTAPVNATTLSGVVTDRTTQTVGQQVTCPEGEVWDDIQKKCVKSQ